MTQHTSYNNINVEAYENRKTRNSFEQYMYEYWNPIIVELIQSHSERKKTLDLGCGTGTYLGYAYHKASVVVGLDASQNMIKYAKNKFPNLELICGDAQKTNYESENFDFIYSIGLLEYVNIEAFMRESFRILRSGGKFLILTPNKYGGRKFVTRFLKRNRPTTAKYYSRSEVLAELKTAGFSIDLVIMNDGLIYLPSFVPNQISRTIFKIIEILFKPFSRNPFSQNMIFIATKTSGGKY